MVLPVAGLALPLLLLMLGPDATMSSASKPHIVFALTDDLGWNTMSVTAVFY